MLGLMADDAEKKIALAHLRSRRRVADLQDLARGLEYCRPWLLPSNDVLSRFDSLEVQNKAALDNIQHPSRSIIADGFDYRTKVVS